jgi:putative tricarboxylic transport membrane protein
MGKRSKRYELLFNLILIALGLYITVASIEIGFGTFKEPQAGFFPFLGGLLMVLSNLIVIVRKDQESGTIFRERTGIRIFFSIILIYLFWLLAMPFLGYVIVTFLASFGLSKVMKLEGWVKPFIFSLAVAFFIYLMFDYWLYLDFPRGILG